MSEPEQTEELNGAARLELEDEGEFEEIGVLIDEDGLVCVKGTDWEFCLTPDEARELATALLETADEAEEALEDEDDDEEEEDDEDEKETDEKS